jgi:hypothetical protein
MFIDSARRGCRMGRVACYKYPAIAKRRTSLQKHYNRNLKILFCYSTAVMHSLVPLLSRFQIRLVREGDAEEHEFNSELA